MTDKNAIDDPLGDLSSALIRHAASLAEHVERKTLERQTPYRIKDTGTEYEGGHIHQIAWLTRDDGRGPGVTVVYFVNKHGKISLWSYSLDARI